MLAMARGSEMAHTGSQPQFGTFLILGVPKIFRWQRQIEVPVSEFFRCPKRTGNSAFLSLTPLCQTTPTGRILEQMRYTYLNQNALTVQARTITGLLSD